VSMLLGGLPDGHKLLRTREVALAVGAGRRAVLAALEAGRFPGAFRTPGGHWRIPADTVRALRAELGITEEPAS